MTFRPTFEAKENVSEAENTVVTLNQPVQDSSPWRLTLDTELPANNMRYITQRQLVDRNPWDELFLDRRYYSSVAIIAI